MLDFRFTEFSEVRIPRSTASDPAPAIARYSSTARHSAPRGEDADVGDLTRGRRTDASLHA